MAINDQREGSQTKTNVGAAPKVKADKDKVKSSQIKKKPGYWSKLDRSEIRRIKYYIFSIQIVIFIIIIINAMYESIIIDTNNDYLSFGFYMPIGYLLLFVLLLVFLLSAEGLWFKFIQIKNAHSFQKRNKLIKDNQQSAQSALVITIVILIILLSLNFLPFISGMLKTENSFEISPNKEKDNRFEEQDAFGLTHTNSITFDANNSVLLNLVFRELSNDMDSSEINYNDLGNHTKKEVQLESSNYQLGYTPNKKYYFFIKNIENYSVSGKIIIHREISKPFISNVLLFMILFLVTSITWLAYLSVIHKKYESLHDEKTKQLTKRYAVKPYTIEDVFFIYRDGVLITHQTRRLKAMDNDILSGMLTAIKDFTQDAFKGESKGQLNELKHGKLKILIEHGQFAYMAVVVSGRSTGDIRTRMKQVLSQVHRQYFHQLKDFNGEVGTFEGVKKIIDLQILSATDTGSQFDEDSHTAWNNKGVVFTKLGKFNEAIDCFDSALKINSKVSNVWLNRGIALVKLNEFKEAMDCFDRALQLDPNNESTKRRRNKCWYKWRLLEGRDRQLAGGGGRRPSASAYMPPMTEPGPLPGPVPGPVPLPGPGTGAGTGYDQEYDMPAEEPEPRCPGCGQPLSFIDEYESWYCEVCDSYPYDD